LPEVRHKKFVFILTKNVEAEYYRALVVISLADKLSQIQKTPLFEGWRDILHILSVSTRPNLLSDIAIKKILRPHLDLQKSIVSKTYMIGIEEQNTGVMALFRKTTS
jgi:hypothetical protein